MPKLHSCVHEMRVWDDEGNLYSRCGFGCGENSNDDLFERIAAAASLPMRVTHEPAPSTQVAAIVPVPTTTTLDLRPERPFNPRVNVVSTNENPSFTVVATPPSKRPPTPVEMLTAARPDWVPQYLSAICCDDAGTSACTCPRGEDMRKARLAYLRSALGR